MRALDCNGNFHGGGGGVGGGGWRESNPIFLLEEFERRKIFHITSKTK